jgi:glycosyltransferase involved in cell wall biosynthesis
MNIGILTWEFPPRIVGGVARHCYGLAKALAHKRLEVHVITLGFPGAPGYEEIEGVKINRFPIELGHPNFITWTLLFNHFLEKGLSDLSQKVELDLLHVHDWLVAPSGISFKHFMDKPMVLTVHSTEHGRSSLHSPDSYTIDGIEWWSTYEASKIIVASNSMRDEVCGHFHIQHEKVKIIPNGIDVTKFQVSTDRQAVRSRYGVQPHEKLVLCVGRLVPQKGIEYLIRAVPAIADHYPEAKFVFVGEGWMRDYLESVSRSTGHQWKIKFTGFISDEELAALMPNSDVLVIPSIYEPFGIVALEGMAAGVPVVASQVGGLAEVIEHDRTGVFVYPRNPESIAWGVDRMLSNPDHAMRMAKNARETVEKQFSWKAIAGKTVDIYKEALGD